LLKTFTLCIIIIILYDHLNNFQNLTVKSFTFISWMFILLFLSEVMLFEFSKNYFDLIVILLLRNKLLLFRIKIQDFYFLKQFLIIEIKLHISHHKVFTNEDCINQVMYIDEMLFISSKHVTTSWIWDSFLLKSFYVIILLMILT